MTNLRGLWYQCLRKSAVPRYTPLLATARLPVRFAPPCRKEVVTNYLAKVRLAGPLTVSPEIRLFPAAVLGGPARGNHLLQPPQFQRTQLNSQPKSILLPAMAGREAVLKRWG